MVEEEKQETEKAEPEVAKVSPIHLEDERGGKKKHLLSCEKTQ
ncbi:MAG: hypothetical protein AB3K77_14635 [Methanosarcinaceae archaeon]|nr:hypothetical protein [Methanosarcina sp. MTP4]